MHDDAVIAQRSITPGVTRLVRARALLFAETPLPRVKFLGDTSQQLEAEVRKELLQKEQLAVSGL
jgi:hypothetical protein